MLYGGGDAGTLRFPLFILYANVRRRERERERRPTTAGRLPYYHLYLLTLFCDLFIHAALHEWVCCVDPARVILLYYPFGLRERRQTGDFPSIIYIQSERRRRREKGQRDKNRDVRC